MCLAIEEIKKEYAAEQVAKEITKSVDGIMKKFNVSLEDACESIEHTVEDYENAKQLLEKIEVAQFKEGVSRVSS